MGNKVIEGLKCCSVINSCPVCPYNKSGRCLRELHKDALDDIGNSEAKLKVMQAEIDRLSQVVLYNDSVTAMKITEALQEFAQRLKKKKSRDILGIEWVRPYVIDKVLKEMEEIYET